MIYETIVSTLDAGGRPNFAPMGIGLEGETVVLRPFRTAVTWTNLRETGAGVVNVTDNVLLFARCALTGDVPAHHPAAKVHGVILDDVCHWKEFEIASSDLTADRGFFRGRIVAAGRERDLPGFNRAQHAVVEATILATRLHLTGADPVRAELERLRPLIEKTGGERERLAFACVEEAVGKA